MKKLGLALLFSLWTCGGNAGELDDLVRQVREAQRHDQQADDERKARFLAEKNQQQKLLSDTKALLAKAEAESKALREQFSANKTRLKELDTEFKTKSGDLVSLYGAVREFSVKFKSDLETSLVSSQFPGRADLPERIAFGKEVPTATEMENLWLDVLQEMAEAGKTVKFHGAYTDTAGKHRDADIYRIGAFSALADGKYLRYLPMSGRLEELPQQPEDTERAGTKDLPGSLGKMAMVTIDPSRGTVLDATLQTASGSPKWIPDSIRSLMSTEVDVAIIGLLLVSSIWAFAVAIERWQYYRRVDINRFLSRSELETELTRNLTVIGTVAANAPFVGLLGTVLGIMMTFHKMSTEKGMDVHSIMVGLSVALKATAMGLLVAIPCVVLNNVLRRRIRELVTAYEVQVGS